MVVAASVPLLELRGVSKHFGAVQALTDIQFDVHADEVVALVGDNGAGKSTLVKLISGIYAVDSGTFLWEGREVTISGPGDAAALGIATVYQDLALCDNLDVVANLYLGREAGSGGALGRMDEVTMEKRSIEVLRRLSVKIPSVRIPIAQPVRRPAPVRGGRPVRAVGQQGGPARRADRRARRRPDPRGPRARQASPRRGPGRGHHQPQPGRRLRGGRPDHGPAARSLRRDVRREARRAASSSSG